MDWKIERKHLSNQIKYRIELSLSCVYGTWNSPAPSCRRPHLALWQGLHWVTVLHLLCCYEKPIWSPSFCFLGYFIVIAKWIGQQFWAFNTFRFKSLPILCAQCSNALESFSDLQEPESLFYDYWCSIVRSCVLVSCSSLHIVQFLSDSQLQRKFYFVWGKKKH